MWFWSYEYFDLEIWYLLSIKSVILFGLVGRWRGRGVRISYREGNSFMGSQGILVDIFSCYFIPFSLICWFVAKFIYTWQLGMNFDLTRSNSKVLHVFPFNSEKKRGGVALKLVIIWLKYPPIHPFIYCTLYEYQTKIFIPHASNY